MITITVLQIVGLSIVSVERFYSNFDLKVNLILFQKSGIFGRHIHLKHERFDRNSLHSLAKAKKTRFVKKRIVGISKAIRIESDISTRSM